MGSEGHRIVIKTGSGNSSSRNFTWLEQNQKLAFICTSPRNSPYLLFIWWAEVRENKWKGFPQRPSVPLPPTKENEFVSFCCGRVMRKNTSFRRKKCHFQSFMIYTETAECQHFQMFRSLLENKTYFQKFLGLEVQISFTLMRPYINSTLVPPQGCSSALTKAEDIANLHVLEGSSRFVNLQTRHTACVSKL